MPKGGQQCRLTLVDHTVADVRTLNDVISDGDSNHCICDVSADVVDGPVTSTVVKVCGLLQCHVVFVLVRLM